MKMSFTKVSLFVGKIIAITGLLLGTVLILSYYYSRSDELVIIGYSSLISMVILTLIWFIVHYFFSNDKKNLKQKNVTYLLLLINFPISILYFIIFLHLSNLLTITVVNETSETIKNINMIGAEPKIIDKLIPNEKETVNLEIIQDGQLEIEYYQQNKLKRDTVIGYFTHGSGMAVTYRICVDTNNLDMEK